MNIERLDKAMRLRGVNDPALCAALGIRRSVIRGWRVSGAPRVTAERLYRCAEVLRVPPEWLAGRRDLRAGYALAERVGDVAELNMEDRVYLGMECLDILDAINAVDSAPSA